VCDNKQYLAGITIKIRAGVAAGLCCKASHPQALGSKLKQIGVCLRAHSFFLFFGSSSLDLCISQYRGFVS